MSNLSLRIHHQKNKIPPYNTVYLECIDEDSKAKVFHVKLTVEQFSELLFSGKTITHDWLIDDSMVGNKLIEQYIDVSVPKKWIENEREHREEIKQIVDSNYEQAFKDGWIQDRDWFANNIGAERNLVENVVETNEMIYRIRVNKWIKVD